MFGHHNVVTDVGTRLDNLTDPAGASKHVGRAASDLILHTTHPVDHSSSAVEQCGSYSHPMGCNLNAGQENPSSSNDHEVAS